MPGPSGSVAMGKLFNLTMPQTTYLSNGDNDATTLCGYCEIVINDSTH